MTLGASTWEALLGIALGALIGWLGYRRRTLSRGGALCVVAVLGLTFGLGGWVWGSLPLLSLVSLDVTSHYHAEAKRKFADRFREGTSRDAGRILAGLGWAVLLSWFHWLVPSARSFVVAYVGAVATATADAWATELGVLNLIWPRSLSTGRRVPPGTPGGVSALGTVAAIGGAWLIGFVALGLTVISAWASRAPWDRLLLWMPLLATSGGLAGCFVDSLLGATAQGYYFCERCNEHTEERVHSCGEKTQQVRGWSWLTNNGVNFVSSVVGAAVAGTLGIWLAQSNAWW